MLLKYYGVVQIVLIVFSPNCTDSTQIKCCRFFLSEKVVRYNGAGRKSHVLAHYSILTGTPRRGYIFHTSSRMVPRVSDRADNGSSHGGLFRK